MKRETVVVARLRTDGGTQSRVSISESAIEEYTEALAAGAEFPPIVVFYDGDENWLADGFQRVEAYQRVGKDVVIAEVHQGSQRDAQLYSFGANDAHGLRRSNADRRHVVERMLADREWAKWSDREIARQCRVSHPFVAKVRAAGGNVSTCEPAPTRIGRDGKDYPLPKPMPGPRGRVETAVGYVEPRTPRPAADAPPPCRPDPADTYDREDELKRIRDVVRDVIDGWREPSLVLVLDELSLCLQLAEGEENERRSKLG